MDDLFSVPIGYAAPGEEEDGDSISPVPPDAYDYPGKWLALHAAQILAVRNTPAELEQEFGDRRHEISFFHVPTSTIFAR